MTMPPSRAGLRGVLHAALRSPASHRNRNHHHHPFPLLRRCCGPSPSSSSSPSMPASQIRHSRFCAASGAPRLGSAPCNASRAPASPTSRTAPDVTLLSRKCTPQRRAHSSSHSSPTPTLLPPDYLDDKERAIFETLERALGPTALEVQDISGGCGSMYAVNVTSAKFGGLTVIKQHRLVNEILGEQIKTWHGLQLRTKTP